MGEQGLGLRGAPAPAIRDGESMRGGETAMEITDLGHFVDAVRELVERWTLPDADWYPSLWFRGHGNAKWNLESGWYRLPPPGEGVGAEWYNERTLLLEFKFRAPRYLQGLHTLPSNDWEWLFLMQHYGLPTRLLDWTESSLIGLYFALRDNRGDCDAAVWVLNPWWLNKQSLGEYDIPQAGDPRVAEWAPLGEGKILQAGLPVAIKPIHASPRISVQKGFFTMHGAERSALDRLSNSRADRGPGLRKLTIPKEHAAEMRRDLAVAGITETTVFPELDGLCREIRSGFLGS